jgi:predicted SnoaL-like aldol condensation-catalyzing enzyme
MPTSADQNKKLVLEAFDTLFNRRKYAAAEKFWSPHYLQHSAHIEPGRDGLFNLVRSAPPTLKYETGLIVAEGDYVIVHGRFSGRGSSVNWIAADILRIKDGLLVEHWDVLQDEVSKADSKSGLPMFGTEFP